MNRHWLAALLLLVLTGAGLAEGDVGTKTPSLHIELFSPQGTVKAVRQVSARFDQPMVALGDPRLPDPFVVSCAVPGNGRWADGRNWVYDFDADLPAGLRCKFSTVTRLHALDGARLAAARSFSFTTGGPAILGSLPREGSQAIDEDQIFILKLDAPAALQSIQSHAHCLVEGIAERVAVEILDGDERARLLKQRAALGYDYYRLLWKNGRVSDARVRQHRFETGDDSLIVLHCLRRLPPGTAVRLVWGRGVETASGIATVQDQSLAFRVRPAFTALVECGRTNEHSGCLPIQAINLSFSAPVPVKLAMQARLKARDGTLYSPLPPASGQLPTVEQLSFAAPFPERSSMTVLLPEPLVDDAGRPLENAARFPLELPVGDYPPLVKFSAEFGILELKEGGVLPVTLRNVEPQLAARTSSFPAKMLRLASDPAAVADWLRRVELAAQPSGEWIAGTANAREWREDTGARSVFGPQDQTNSFVVTKPLGKQTTEVIGIPLKESGFYVVELESRLLGASLLGRDATRYVSTAALVTNLAVHFKWGRESSRVWVTRLDSGKPFADAEVTISDFCSGAPLWNGKTAGDGLAVVGQSIGDPHSGQMCNAYSPHPLLVTAKTANDFSFTQSGWGQGITPYQFSIPVGNQYSADIYHTVFDRPLFKAGETVSMMHFLRRHEMQGLATQQGMPAVRGVAIVHRGSGQRFDLQAQFGADGIAETQWTIPAEAKLGDYAVSIEDAAKNLQPSGGFKVEQFRLPTMRASIVLPALPQVRPKHVPVDLHIAYLSGGGAPGLAVKLRTLVEPQPLRFPGYDDYEFGGEPVTEGILVEGNDTEETDSESPTSADSAKAQVMPLNLDAAGSARAVISKLPPIEVPSRLIAEIEYADANGQLLTSAAHVRLVPSALAIGIRRDAWVASAEQLRFRVVVLDLEGKPRPGVTVNAAFYQSNAYSYRKRLMGGFYAYETSRDTRKLDAGCTGVSNAQGVLICEVAPGATGEVLIRAETQDAAGQTAGATTSIWVAGKEDWWFGGTSGDRMDLLPEKKQYESGEVARLQVRMPFRDATALVTVEREGVLSSFVTHLNGHAPIVNVPIADAYSPNVFISVLAVRGRVAHAELAGAAAAREITALVDLDKPSYRLGVAEIKVGWKPHRLDVAVDTGSNTFKVRDEVPVHIHVARADGAALAPGGEVTIAAVDEALLDLVPNPSWALLDAMMGERGLEVWTSTAQMQVVGKRHYGRKAVPHGGGGGRETDRSREQFDSLLLWKGRLLLDSNGDAVVRVPLNDSLSSFRIVAIAHSGAQLYGTGSASIATTQDLILLSGLPMLVREGDKFAATFTVRNTTQTSKNVDLTATLTPPLPTPPLPLHGAIPAGQSREFTWQVGAPVGTSTMRWQVQARDSGGSAFDRLKITQSVTPAYPLRTYQATILQLDQPTTIPVQRPRGAAAGRGGLEIGIRAKLGDGLDGVRDYMGRYPYVCLEQRLSRAVALRDRAAWDAMMDRLPAYMDSDGLLKYFPSDRLEGEDTLSAYVLSIADEAGWPLAEADKQRVLNALQLFVTGKLVRRSALPTADLTIRKLSVLDAMSRYGAAKPGMLDSLTIEPNLWPTSAVLDWLDVLRRVDDIPQAQARRDEALQVLRSRLNFQGTVMGFSTERSDALWWLMISTDSNANRLLLATLDLPEWREDVPRLVRGALARQQDGHWNTTVANAWGVLAMEKFSRAFESTEVGGATAVQYSIAKRIVTWPQPQGFAQIDFPWAEGRQNLGLAHIGGGKPWIMMRATAALPLEHALFTGFKIWRTVTPVDQKNPGQLTRGDVLRVRLEMEAQSDAGWVVVDDPIPAGATPLGSALGGESALAQRGESRTGWAWPAYEERRFDAYRAYYRFVPKGRWSTEYTIRLDNPGTFLMPASRVEAMYAPEMFGELPNSALTVEPAP